MPVVSYRSRNIKEGADGWLGNNWVRGDLPRFHCQFSGPGYVTYIPGQRKVRERRESNVSQSLKTFIAIAINNMADGRSSGTPLFKPKSRKIYG